MLKIRAILIGASVFVAGASVFIFAVTRQKGETDRPVYVIDVSAREEITSSGSVRHVYGADGKTIIEKHIAYPEGGKGVVYNRPGDGTVRNTIETFGKSGLKRSEALWSDDGTTVLQGDIYRPDGSLRLHQERKNGNLTVNLFAPGGKWLVKTTVTSLTLPQKEDVFFDKNGGVLARVYYRPNEKRSSGVSESATETFFDGVKRLRIENLKGAKQVTYYAANGTTITHVQIWRTTFDSFLSTSEQLAEVHEYRSGSVVRKLVFVEEKGVVKLIECQTPLAGSTTRTCYFRKEEQDVKPISIESWMNDSNKRERFLHAGTLKLVEETGKEPVAHAATEAVKETVDPELLKRLTLKELAEARRQLSEDLSYLGNRNDENPCKWYMR